MTAYAGNGSGGFAAKLKIGTGWGGFSQVWEAGDFDGDGKPDVLARTAQGALLLYSGNGSGGFRAVRQIGSGWQAFDQVVSAGNFNGAGGPDLVARNPDGSLLALPHRRNGALPAPEDDRQRLERLLADACSRRLLRRRKDGHHRPVRGRQAVALPGQRDGRLPAAEADRFRLGRLLTRSLRSNDFNGDGKGRPDGPRRRTARSGSTPATAPPVSSPSRQLGAGWNAFTTIASVGRFAGTGNPNVVAVAADGTLGSTRAPGTGAFQNVVLNPR